MTSRSLHRRIAPAAELLFLLSAILFFATPAFALIWTPQASGVPNKLNSVFFPDDKNGWVVGATGLILKTADSGATWTSQSSTAALSINDIKMVSTFTGCAVGENGLILKSTDGVTWAFQTSGVASSLFGLFMIDGVNYWAVGAAGSARTTSDGGVTWTNGDPGGNLAGVTPRSVFFVNTSTGWVVGDITGLNGAIYKTQDGGASWIQQTNGVPAQNLKSVFFVSDSTGFVVGSSGTILKTMDSGTSWTSQISTAANFNSLHCVSTSTAWFVGDTGVIFTSSDSAVSFSAERSTSVANLNKVFMINPGLGFAVGDSGTIIRGSSVAAAGGAFVPEVPQGSLIAMDNLFDPSKGQVTTLQYGLLNPGKVVLKIYTLQGRVVRVLVNNDLAAGSYSIPWDGKNEDGQTVATGIYYAHIEVPKFSTTRKIAVVQ